ncbi:MAG: BtpA/SgcQ family protein [Deltaproteobacteria bacterium]|nr:BtpA/SgcQ family protein [Deltaproteobacteria bacterium]
MPGVPALIGVIHLPPLPGAPRFEGAFETVRELARQDARTLEAAGFGAIVVENFGDAPFFPRAVPPETVAAMAVVAADLRATTGLPLGVNVLRNDAHAALAVAAASGAGFVRVNVHTGARVADQGILEGAAHDTLRLRRALGLDHVALWCDVDVKHSAPVHERPLGDEVADVVERGLADVVLVTGSRTGAGTDLADVRSVVAATAKPVVVASGVTAATVCATLEVAAGVIVGSALRAGGRPGGPIDAARARAFVEAARGGRR